MRKQKRGLTAGSRLMLVMIAAVLMLSAAVLLRWMGGSSPDPIRTQERTATDGAAATAAPAASGQEAAAARAPGNSPAASAAADRTDAPAETRRAELSAAGIFALGKNLRQSCYAADTKVYDFTELLSLLKTTLRSDVSTVFLENLLMDDTKVSDLIVPASAADAMTAAGFQLGLCGFSRAWERKAEGIASTALALRERGITPLGTAEGEGEARYVIQDVNGIRIALAQYTADVSSTVRKNMKKAGSDWAVPEADPEIIAADLTAARAAGADFTVVFLHWGKVGATKPDKTQTALAQQIADAGADVIIGAGSRTVQPAEYLTAGDGRQVLCAWSLGTLMSDDRNTASRIGGMILHLTLEGDAAGTVRLVQAAYTPTYVWKYRQDSKYYYKCLAANQTPPDGMDSEQTRLMEKTLQAAQKALEGSPVDMR